MIKELTTVFLLLSSFSGFTQLIRSVEIPFNEITDFNPEYIKANRINGIDLTYASKKDGEIIINRSVEKSYRFNDKGEPYEEVYIEKRGVIKDSLISFYKFNEAFQLTEQTDKYLNQEVKKTITYNQEGRIKKEVVLELKNNNIDTSTIINYTEPYSDKNFTKRFILNSENRPFIEQRFYYDELGRIINKEEDLYITARSRNKKWEYDGERLIKISYSDQINTKAQGEYTFEYHKNKLEYIYQYETEELIKKIAFVYAVDDPSLLEALVIRYPKKETIEIITIKYR